MKCSVCGAELKMKLKPGGRFFGKCTATRIAVCPNGCEAASDPAENLRQILQKRGGKR